MPITQYNFTNLDKSGSSPNDLRITFGVLPKENHGPKVPKNASKYQKVRIFENVGGTKKANTFGGGCPKIT